MRGKEQERRMRHLCLGAVLGGLAFVGLTAAASAMPALPSGLHADQAAPLVEKAGYWKRYWRRHGYAPGLVPGADADEAVVVEDGPILVPLRPASCGQYHYWDGTQCLDARYHNPDLGPKP
jgi:hypothetical protein